MEYQNYFKIMTQLSIHSRKSKIELQTFEYVILCSFWACHKKKKCMEIRVQKWNILIHSLVCSEFKSVYISAVWNEINATTIHSVLCELKWNNYRTETFCALYQCFRFCFVNAGWKRCFPYLSRVTGEESSP